MTVNAKHHDNYPNDLIDRLLAEVKTIALVGFSANDSRPSYGVTKFLIDHCYTLFLINPGLAGQVFFGAPVYATLADIPAPVDMVDIFRNSEGAGLITDEALALSPLPKVIWMQLGVRHDEAAARAENKGVHVIMNRCPKIELARTAHRR